MTTNLKAVREGIQARLLLIGSTGYSFLDLRTATNPDAVKVGHYVEPWKSGQQACLWLVRVERTTGPTLPGHSQKAIFGCLIWFPATADDPETKEDAIEDAWTDVTRRWRAQTDRTLGGIALDTDLTLDDLLGAEAAQAGTTCVLAVRFTATFREDLP